MVVSVAISENFHSQENSQLGNRDAAGSRTKAFLKKKIGGGKKYRAECLVRVGIVVLLGAPVRSRCPPVCVRRAHRSGIFQTRLQRLLEYDITPSQIRCSEKVNWMGLILSIRRTKVNGQVKCVSNRAKELQIIFNIVTRYGIGCW